MARQTLFKTILLRIETTTIGSHGWGEIGLNYDYNKDKNQLERETVIVVLNNRSGIRITPSQFWKLMKKPMYDYYLCIWFFTWSCYESTEPALWESRTSTETNQGTWTLEELEQASFTRWSRWFAREAKHYGAMPVL